MTKKWMAVLALGLVAPAAFGQTATPTAAPLKILRGEIKRDKGDMTGKTKAVRAELKELRVQEKAELAKAGKTSGTRAEKKQARLAVRRKYERMFKDLREKTAFERKNLREDVQAKRGQIQKLRQS